MLNEGLLHNSTLKRLSFAGSHMGDVPLQSIREGLVAHNAMEELDLTACALTNDGAYFLGSIVKVSTQRLEASASFLGRYVDNE